MHGRATIVTDSLIDKREWREAMPVLGIVATKKDGTRFLAWLRLMPLCDDDDSLWPTRFVGILEDHCSMRRAPSL